MPPDRDDDERRMLQQKAYARDGALTPEEARRLSDLERRGPEATPPSAAPAPPPVQDPGVREPAASVPSASALPASALPGSALPGSESSLSPASEPDPAREPSTLTRIALRLLRRRGWAVAAASALLLALGVGAGWALFAPHDSGVALTAEQQQRRLELAAEGDYDEGSVRALGRDGDAIAWFGTQQGGETICLVLDAGGQSSEQCRDRDDGGPFVMSAGVSVFSEREDEAIAGQTTVSAILLFTTEGEPAVAIQRFEDDGDLWLQRFSGDERTRAEELARAYDARGITIVGSFRDEPVWVIDRFEDNTSQTCLIVDAVRQEPVCTTSTAAISDGISTLVFVDDGAGGSEPWGIQVAYTVDQTPYLVITRDPQPASMTFSEYREKTEAEDDQPEG